MDTLPIKKRKVKAMKSKPLYTSEDVFDAVKTLATESGNTLQSITDDLLSFALKHVVIVDEEDES